MDRICNEWKREMEREYQEIYMKKKKIGEEYFQKE